MGKLKKYGLHTSDFYINSQRYYHSHTSDIYIEVLTTPFIRDCININCKAGYKKSIISALCRQWNLHQNIPPQVLWEALGMDDFKKDIMLAAYKK